MTTRTESEMGLCVKWPLAIYVCQTCARPSLFKEDRCCSGFYDTVYVEPIEVEPEVYEYMIEELEMAVRPYNILKNEGINTIGELMKKSRKEIEALPSMGKMSMDSLEKALAEFNLRLKED